MDPMIEALGCLKDLRTPDHSATRRHPEVDEDRWQYSRLSRFQLDYEKVISCKAYRRLADKTQVMTGIQNRHVRNRLVHTSEVVANSMLIAESLGLNTWLAMAIAAAHDIGHTPFGHLGEQFLSRVSGHEFRHNIFGVVVAQHIERKGKGLNLTNRVLAGIAQHSRGSGDLLISDYATPEANVVMFADKISYTWGDFNDLFRYKRTDLDLDDFPELKEEALWFGTSQRERIKKTIEALFLECAEERKVAFQNSETAVRFDRVRKLMYTVYDRVNYKGEEAMRKVYSFIRDKLLDVDPIVAFALLCDHEVIELAKKEELNLADLKGSSFSEMLPYLKGRGIAWSDPDLFW